jgi:uncharacterized protein YdhG (YjbR/CyaY superfamily)
VPTAQEKISYGIPTFALGSNLFHFAAFKAHIGLYPGAAAIKAFAAQLTSYRTSKGTNQIPLDLVDALLDFNLKARALKATGQRVGQRLPLDDAQAGGATGLTSAATPPTPR